MTDVTDTRSRVGSSLTSVDLAGLTRVELGFALVLAASAAGWCRSSASPNDAAPSRSSGCSARRRGSRARWSGPRCSSSRSAACSPGGLVGLVLTRVLVAVLTGVFDPPPAAVTVPWTYLVVTAGICVVALVAAAQAAVRRRRGGAVELLREVVISEFACATGAAAPFPNDLQHERDQPCGLDGR